MTKYRVHFQVNKFGPAFCRYEVQKRVTFLFINFWVFERESSYLEFLAWQIWYNSDIPQKGV